MALYLGYYGMRSVKTSHNLFLNLLIPTRTAWRLAQGLAVGIIAFAVVMILDVVGDGQLAVSPLGYAAQTVIVGVPITLLLRGISVEIRRMRLRLDGIENRDALTALYNRAAFLRKTTRALPQSGALLMLDVDELKAINRKLGHGAGDLCLMALSMKLRECTRETDIVGRLDGATFAIYMSGAPSDIAQCMARRLGDGIQVTTAYGLLHVAVSVGAVVADGHTPLDKLLRDAAGVLQRAKLIGRGGVILKDLLAVA